MTLPSNASMDEFPTNSAAQFTTRLQNPIELEEQWEVAIVEASVPRKWVNEFPDTYMRVKLPLEQVIESDVNPKPITLNQFRWVKSRLPNKRYRTGEDLINILNTVYNQILERSFTNSWKANRTKQTILNYDTNVGMVFSNPKPKYSRHIVQVSGQIALALGVGDGTRQWVSLSQRRYSVDLRRGQHHIFVYSDIVQYVPVGDVSAPLLRVIPLSTSFKDPSQYSHVFEKPHYIPVTRRNIETLHLDLRNDTGELIPFLHGKSIVKLHFRRRRPL